MNAPFDVRGPTAERLLDVRTPIELALAPDGALAFTLAPTVTEVGSVLPSDLWMLRGDELEQLTGGPWSDQRAAWSPDGTRLAFLSDRITPGHSLPYTMTLGGEPTAAATSFLGSAESVAWSADGARLLVRVADPGCYGLDWSARAVTGAVSGDPIVERPGDALRRLFLVELATGDVREVGPPGQSVWEVDWDGEGTVVALTSEDPLGGSGWYRSRVVRLDLAERTADVLYRPEWQLEGLALAPDGRRAAVVEGYSSDPGLLIGSLKIVDLLGGGVADPWPELQTVGLVEWCDDASIWYASAEGTQTACGRVWLDGRHEERWRGDAFIGDEVTKPKGTVAGGGEVVWTTHQGHGVPPELARLEAGAWRRLTSFNDAIVAGVTFPDVRTIRWTSTDGLEIEGRLMTPNGATGPLPLLALVHGGPTWFWGPAFSDSEPNAVLLAGAGYACLLPNPRGSVGRGHAFARGVIGDPGGLDFDDIMTGVDHCIAEGSPTPRDSASQGSPTTDSWPGAVTQTDRFGAAVAMSVVSNYVSFHLTSEVWMYDEMILEGEWDDPAGPYPERSPVTHARKCTTPTLVLQGAADRCTPIGQGQELYTALAASGADVELVIYPREGHVCVERAHALDAIRRTQTWFDRHLGSGSDQKKGV